MKSILISLLLALLVVWGQPLWAQDATPDSSDSQDRFQGAFEVKLSSLVLDHATQVHGPGLSASTGFTLEAVSLGITLDQATDGSGKGFDEGHFGLVWPYEKHQVGLVQAFRTIKSGPGSENQKRQTLSLHYSFIPQQGVRAGILGEIVHQGEANQQWSSLRLGFSKATKALDVDFDLAAYHFKDKAPAEDLSSEDKTSYLHHLEQSVTLRKALLNAELSLSAFATQPLSEEAKQKLLASNGENRVSTAGGHLSILYFF